MPKFSHEKLNVYQEGLKFITWLSDLNSKGRIKGNILNQLERASNSGKEILLNIVNMLVGLIRSNSDRVYEPEEEYKKSD